MRAYVIFSSSEPVLAVTRQSIRSRAVLDELRRIGCLKFIAREVQIDHVRCQYGDQYDAIERAVKAGSALRVLDFNGRRIFRHLPFSEFGRAYRLELPDVVSQPDRRATSTDRNPASEVGLRSAAAFP